MSARRRHVMCDDILGLIFKRLDIKDLFSLQRVSHQFNDCSQEVLQNRREVSVGFNNLKTSSKLRCFKPNFEVKDWNRIDITPAVTLKGTTFPLNYDRLESIVHHFHDVKKLYLSSTVISFQTFKLMVSEWPQLNELYIYDIDFYGLSEHTITDWTRLMSKFKDIVIGSVDTKYMSLLRDIIAHLPSLQSVNVWGITAYHMTLSSITDCLSANIQCLHIGVNAMDSQAVDVITSKCPQIKQLSIYECCPHSTQVFDLWRQWFAMVCDRLKALTYLRTVLFNISAKEFAESIAKLKHLQTLEIRSGDWLLPQEMPRMCFNTQEMARYMPPMVSLKTLSLRSLYCSPNRWSNFTKVFPNVRHLTVDNMYYRMDCKHGYDCNKCFYRCMDLVSKLPKLRQILICNAINGRITRHILELFAGVDHMIIDSAENLILVDELIHFIGVSLDNRRRVFRLDLKQNLKKLLIQRMATMNFPMPGRVIVGHVFSLRYLPFV